MSIKTYAGLNDTMRNYQANEWSKKLEIGKMNLLENDSGINSNGASSGKGFGDLLAESIAKVNDLQQTAEVSMQKIASGESNNIHETLLAVEKADTAFRLMNQVRSKVLDAYREIMRMQV